MIQLPLRLTLYPYTTLFRSGERQPEVRLADTGGAIDDGERARQQAPTEHRVEPGNAGRDACAQSLHSTPGSPARSEEHTSELQSHSDLVCRLLLEKKKNKRK